MKPTSPKIDLRAHGIAERLHAKYPRCRASEIYLTATRILTHADVEVTEQTLAVVAELAQARDWSFADASEFIALNTD